MLKELDIVYMLENKDNNAYFVGEQLFCNFVGG